MKIAYNSACVQIETPNINVQADYFLPKMSGCTLISSKQLIDSPGYHVALFA